MKYHDATEAKGTTSQWDVFLASGPSVICCIATVAVGISGDTELMQQLFVMSVMVTVASVNAFIQGRPAIDSLGEKK